MAILDQVIIIVKAIGLTRVGQTLNLLTVW